MSQEELIVEVMAGEGGDDSKLFVSDLAIAYVKYAESLSLAVEVLSGDRSQTTLCVTGDGAWEAFKGESGNHCLQRVPPTETRGRVHTSYVSVAVLPIPPDGSSGDLAASEVSLTYTTGTGPGGQHRNRTKSAVRAVHTPTGITVVIDGRNQHDNRRKALKVLAARVDSLKQASADKQYNSLKRETMGSMARGQKVRTYSFVKGRVVDHRTGRKTSNVKAVMRGDFSLVL